MRSLVEQAAENDNLSTLYVVDDEEHFYGAITLQDLIIAREHTDLEDLITTSYPYVYDHENVAECMAAGMNGHIAKPIDIKLVLKELRRIKEAEK